MQILKNAPFMTSELRSDEEEKLANELIAAEEELGNRAAKKKASKKKASKTTPEAAAIAAHPAEARPSQQAGPSQPYLPFHMPVTTTMSTAQLPQQKTVTLSTGMGCVIEVAGGTAHSGSGSGGGIVPTDEDDGPPLCSVCMEAPLSILLAPCGHIELCHKCCESIRAADNLVRCQIDMGTGWYITQSLCSKKELPFVLTCEG